jgi:hypothetical protein
MEAVQPRARQIIHRGRGDLIVRGPGQLRRDLAERRAADLFRGFWPVARAQVTIAPSGTPWAAGAPHRRFESPSRDVVVDRMIGRRRAVPDGRRPIFFRGDWPIAASRERKAPASRALAGGSNRSVRRYAASRVSPDLRALRNRVFQLLDPTATAT